MEHFQKRLLLASIFVVASSLTSTRALSLPTSGCDFNLAPGVFEDCTLVEAPESSEPGGTETITVNSKAPTGYTAGFVPIFESASGGAGSAFPIGTNPTGVTGAVSDYLIVQPGSLTLVSDGFPLIANLLAGLTQLTPLAADGVTPVVVSEPAEDIFNQPVDFYLTRTGQLGHVIIYSDVKVSEPSTLGLLAAGIVAWSAIFRRRKVHKSTA